FYANNPREGVTQFGSSIDGRLDVDTFTQVNLTLTGARSVVDRTDYNSPYGAVSPIAFDRLSARLGVAHVFNRLAVTAQGKVTGLTYHDGLSDAGAVIDQSYRNQTVTSALLDTRYNLTTGFDLLLHGTYERQDFANANALASGALLRNSSGWVVEGGTRLNLTGSLYGEVRVGYLWRSYADPRLLNARGLSFAADLLWNPSSLTTLRLVASRQVQDASSTTAAGILATEVKLGVDHELARNLIVSADAGYLRLKPLGTGYNANTWTGRLSARYLMSRRFTLTASLGREDRASFDTTRAYRANSGWLTLGLTL
ncbi:MAG TPA: outer membrane beta-barrel protein, partial [Novosphingobium sp.]|nr:outer membrane beta-barrel protein [Novosphingobium sp.]